MSKSNSNRLRPRDLSAQATRQLLLDTGVEMVFKRPVTLATSSIRITEVVKRAGVTAGAAYHHWPNQAAYRSDLLDELLKVERLGDIATLGEQLTDPSLGKATAGVVLRTLTRAILISNLGNPSLRVLMGLWVEDDPQTEAFIRDAFSASDEQWIAISQQFFASYGLEVVPPMTVELLVGLTSSFVFGFRIRFGLDAERFEQELNFDADHEAVAELKAFDLALLAWFATFVRKSDSSAPTHLGKSPWQRLTDFYALENTLEINESD
ncbi:MAG: TetR/AcrR family transcriptional regulator [Pseudomonadales bacterium]